MFAPRSYKQQCEYHAMCVEEQPSLPHPQRVALSTRTHAGGLPLAATQLSTCCMPQRAGCSTTAPGAACTHMLATAWPALGHVCMCVRACEAQEREETGTTGGSRGVRPHAARSRDPQWRNRKQPAITSWLNVTCVGDGRGYWRLQYDVWWHKGADCIRAAAHWALLSGHAWHGARGGLAKATCTPTM